MNVGTVRRCVAKELDTLRVIHDPLEVADNFNADPSHAEITGLPPGNSDQAIFIRDLIAKRIMAMHPRSMVKINLLGRLVLVKT